MTLGKNADRKVDSAPPKDPQGIEILICPGARERKLLMDIMWCFTFKKQHVAGGETLL